MITITRTTSSTQFPVTLEEAKRQLKIVDDATMDAEIIDLIRTATEEAETRTNRAYMQQGYQAYISNWSDLPVDRNGYWRILPSPVVQVSLVTYYHNNVLNTLAASNYEVNTLRVPCVFKFTSSNLPQIDNRPDAIIISFTAGYGASSANFDQQREAVPASIKHWIKMQMTTYDQTRQFQVFGTITSNVNQIGNDLLAPYILIE
jgi:uncharacterized phiE125 gp8 family phage protein